MNRNLFILLALLFATFCSANSVSPEMALQIAKNYWRVRNVDKVSHSTSNETSKVEIISPQGKAPLYLVQFSEGWTLVASELSATPILAFSPSGRFPLYEEMPDGMQWLISYYEDAMQFARDSLSDTTICEDWNKLLARTYLIEENKHYRDDLPSSYVLSRMAEVRWNQSTNNGGSCGKAYNAQCPTVHTPSCGHSYVGCSAVALGMVMWYWQWPFIARIPRKFVVFMYFSSPYWAFYSWGESMPPQLRDTTSDYNANQIACLLRDCGYAMHMEYGANGSGASLDSVKSALENVFHYKPVSLKNKLLYPSWYWLKLLKQEIYNGRPVIYCGFQASRKGHSFVLYGYTSEDKFKINWGWGGAYINGEYTLDALGPYDDNAYNFNKFQEALFGIEPDIQQNSKFTIHRSSHTSVKQDFLQNEMIHEIKVYPNPANDYINVVSDQELSQILIVNSFGSCVVNTEESKISISHLPSDVYIVCARTNSGEILQTKFLKR